VSFSLFCVILFYLVCVFYLQLVKLNPVWVPGLRIDPLCLLDGCHKRRLNQAPLNLRGRDAIGWVIWPVKIVPEMTYKVSSGTLNSAHSTLSEIKERDIYIIFYVCMYVLMHAGADKFRRRSKPVREVVSASGPAEAL